MIIVHEFGYVFRSGNGSHTNEGKPVCTANQTVNGNSPVILLTRDYMGVLVGEPDMASAVGEQDAH